MKWDSLLNVSTTTIMESCCHLVLGNLVIKSREIISHFNSGMGSGFNKLEGC